MKKILHLFFISYLFLLSAIAQNANQGMKYQAVARDLSGNELINEPIEIKIQLVSGEKSTKAYYSEIHKVVTNEYGMFSLNIGEGTTLNGNFKNIPWSEENIWMELSLKESNGYEIVSKTKLLAVPYAYYANTAGSLSTNENNNVKPVNGFGPLNGIPSQNWSLFGNSKSNPEKDKLGTTDEADLSIVTNNIERVRILSTGEMEVRENTQFDKNINVSDTLFSNNLITNNLNISSNTADGNYVATFENTNDGKGDGIKIKLGKKATKNNTAAEAIDLPLKVFVGEGFGPENFEQVKELLDGDLSTKDLEYLALLQVPTEEDLLAIGATTCVLTETIGNKLFDFLNSSLSLPATIGPYGVHIGWPVDETYNVVPKITVIPKIPELNLPCESLGEGFKLPKLQFSEFINNPLNKENKFIVFSDNTDWTMGAIQAESVEDWAIQYLDPVFLYDLYSTFKGLDKAKILPQMAVTGKKIAKSYLDIGVQYSSGNGDYAEWLERLDANEVISAGDIVAIKGGKITKDLSIAEQVMAVSHRPIVLGNVPKSGKMHLGNNVAFMGQIPVKVMGPVKTGDYIVGKSDFKGYGIAISPLNMTLEDFNLTVGRSWESNTTDGPKMVITVVGMHNGDYLDILKRYQRKLYDSENRLEILETKVDMLMDNSMLKEINK